MLKFFDDNGKRIQIPDEMYEVIKFIEECVEEQKIHPELADDIMSLIVKDVNLLVRELTK
ncbi:MAG: hypothetical protein NC222_06915 [Staphylococcus sp.]|nr:hypothetical protein [Staphylococcus sp.]